MAEKMRLQKFLSACGIASRRRSEKIINAGRVKVNGHTASVGNSVDPAKDIVKLDGETVQPAGEKIYLAFYKPRGVVSTMEDEKGRKCISDMTKGLGIRVYPIGRLDKDSEGLLLLTNDGAFANMVMHPSRHIAKTYRVTVRPGVKEDHLIRLSSGIVIDGKKTAPAKVRLLEEYPNRAVLEIILYEGRNREIRKMCEVLGLEVARLKRTAEGSVKLGMLKQGAYRELTREELQGLNAQSKKGEAKRRNDRDTGNNRQGGGSKSSQKRGNQRGERKGSGNGRGR